LIWLGGGECLCSCEGDYEMPETTAPRVDPTKEGTTTSQITKAEALKLWTALLAKMRKIAGKNHDRQLLLSHRLTEADALKLREELEHVFGLSENRVELVSLELSQMLQNISGRYPNLLAAEGELQPDAEDEAQAAVSADIDAIVKRLDEGIPQLNARLDALLERQQRLLTA
jgi:uncharacterized protein YceH (UPF0502 family)